MTEELKQKAEEMFAKWKSEQYKDQSTEEKMEFVEHLHTFPKYFEKTFKDGYNKANEWHYVKDGDLPKVSGRYFVYVGGGENGVYSLDFDTEVNAFGYWCLDVGVNLGVRDSIFETVAERDEDEVIAWKEIVLPKEIEA